MPKLIVDEREIEVPEGMKVIEAAERLGIMIPRFCYHPALGSVGACRVCAVKFVDGPAKGIQMSCMIDAQEGMVVSTTDAEVVDFRRHVIEWLMLNHPHDCPVCDEGGHCLLQDMTVSGGHALRRYAGLKRTYTDQNLGPLVQHEMNRCIHCYRCARYYQEFSGYKDLGALKIGDRTYFGRFREGTLQSPFSGNLSDICPTGVYTDKPSRFKGRRWDFDRTPSICRHCALGCHVTVCARYREIVRHEARYSPEVNGHFICDRGRFGFYYTEDANRPRKALIKGQASSVSEALGAAQARLKQVADAHGREAIACATAMSASLETLHVAGKVSRSSGWYGPGYFVEKGQAERIQCAVDRLTEELSVSMRQVENADFILVVGADPVNEAPMLAMAMRQAHRKGAGILVIDPRPVSLPFSYSHLPAHPDELDPCLGALFKGAVMQPALSQLRADAVDYHGQLPEIEDCRESFRKQISHWAHRLQYARRPVVICGTSVVTAATPAIAADGCLLLKAVDQAAGLFYVLPEADSYGAALLAGQAFDQILQRIENDTVKALIIVEWDPILQFPDRARVLRAIEALDQLIVLTHTDGEIGRRADVLLPTTTLYESGGLFINQEGRLQRALPAYRGGTSIEQVGEGDHPPRTYSSELPGCDPRPAWQLMDRLAGDQPPPNPMSLRHESPDPFVDQFLTDIGLPAGTPIPREGLRIALSADPTRCFQPFAALKKEQSADEFLLLTTSLTFGTESLSTLSPPLQKIEPSPCLSMCRSDAVRLKIAEGDLVKIETELGGLSLPVLLCDNMSEGVLMLPRHHRLTWQILEGESCRIRTDQISREPEGR